MKKNSFQLALTILFLFVVFIVLSCSKAATNSSVQPIPVVPVTPVNYDVAVWLTNPNTAIYFQKQSTGLNFTSNTDNNPVINVDTTSTYQSIDGFGFCLTGGSASLINAMPPAQEDALLRELFLTDSTHIGISYLRISIGASDLSASDFTYDDIAQGTDLTLSNFSINAEKTDLIPVLLKIIALNPKIKIMATPWTAPVWMKVNTTGNSGFTGGSLNTTYYDVYAKYIVMYIQAMKAAGITIDAVTPQNEPLNANNNPAMVMQPAEQRDFIKNNLGPQFVAAGLTTKIIVYDHNTDRTDYPLTILGDAVANTYVDGSAFHLYAGNINALTLVHNAYPNKNVYFTEQFTSSTGNFAGDFTWHITNLIIGATKNWSRNVLEWNLATNPNNGPYTNGGCSTCLGALTINAAAVTRNVSYYIIAHASKFVRPGAVRIGSDDVNNLPNVAFKNTDGSKVLIVLNSSNVAQTFDIKIKGKNATATLAGGAVATYVW